VAACASRTVHRRPTWLISPDGEYLHKGASGQADYKGEIICGTNKGAPNPVNNQTDANGIFDYPEQTPVGVYTLEILGPYIARLEGQSLADAKGNVVCRHMDGQSDFNVVLVALPTSLEFVAPDNADNTLNRVRWGEDFRVRADIPGASGDEVEVEVTSYLIRH